MKKIADLRYEKRLPGETLVDFVKCFWTLENTSSVAIPVVIMPDGYFDILFVSVGAEPFKISLIGLETVQTNFTVPAKSRTFAISLKLPAAEYILRTKINGLLDKWQYLEDDSWKLADDAFSNVDSFAEAASAAMCSCLTSKTDERKLELFKKIYQANGDISVEQLSREVLWESRQINRYFRGNFGISLKKYCIILRFSASFNHLHKGQFSLVRGYFDQPHFIREVRKYSGTSPRRLSVNEKDRFIQLSTLIDG